MCTVSHDGAVLSYVLKRRFTQDAFHRTRERQIAIHTPINGWRVFLRRACTHRGHGWLHTAGRLLGRTPTLLATANGSVPSQASNV